MLEEAIPSIWTSLLSWFTPAVFFVLLNLVIGTIAVISKGRSSATAASSAGDPHGRIGSLTRAPSLVLDQLRSFNLSRYAHHEIPTETGHLQSETVPVAGGSVYADGRGVNALTRAPSLVFDRLRSFSLPRFVSGEYQAESGEVEPATDMVNLQLETVPVAGGGAYAGGRGVSALTRAPSLVFDHLRSFGLSRFVSGEYQAKSGEVEAATDMVPGSDSQVEEHEHHDDHHIERSRSEARPSMPKLPVRMKKSASNKSVFSHFEAAGIPKQPTLDEDGEVDAKADDFINKFRNQLKLQRLDSIIRYKEMLTRGAAS